MQRTFDTILYHANCPDGFTGAWVFWREFLTDAEYIPQRYGQEPPDVTGKTVAVVDFSYSREVLLDMVSKAEYLVVLDHHRSAERELAELDLGEKGEIVFDMNRSGAQIAWDYVYGAGEGLDLGRPWFVDYVADRDLWRHALPDTKEISQALFFDDYFTDFAKLDEIDELEDEEYISETKKRFADRGRTLLEYKNKEIASYVRQAVPVTFELMDAVYTVRLVGCPRVYRSEVGNEICKEYDCDFAAMYTFDYSSNEWWISLRSLKERNVDLSGITAQLPTGGGHPQAAGFVIHGVDGEDLYTYFQPVDKEDMEIDDR